MIYLITFLFALTQLGDWITTEKVLSQGGKEDNPVMAKLFKQIPYQLALPLKGIIGTIIAYYVGTYNLYIEIAFVLLYCWVVYHNYTQIRK